MIPDFELVRPISLDEVARHLAEGAAPFVGGTELVAAMQMGLVAPTVLIDLKPIPELNGITEGGSGVTIGAATRHLDIARSPVVRAHAPVLADACAQLGNQRVRATGSIGGNLCFADPRSDVTTALFALDASVTLYSRAGERTVPIDEFILGAMETDRRDDELLRSVHVPYGNNHYAYLRHQPAEYPTVCVAGMVGESQDGAMVRFVVGAVGERPQVLEAPSLDDLPLDDFLGQLDVIEDLNGSERYKRHLVGVFVRRTAVMMKETTDA